MSDLSDVKGVYDRLDEIQLVDCREPYEWEAGRIAGAIHIPVNSIMAGAYPGPGTTLGPALVFAYRAVMNLKAQKA